MKASGNGWLSWFLVGSVALLAAAAVILILSAAGITSDYDSSDDPVSVSVIGEYQIDGGSWQPLDEAMLSNVSDASFVSIRGHLSAAIPQGDELLFYIRNLFVICRVNGTTIYTFGTDGTYPASFRSPGITWGRCGSDGISEEDTVEFVIRNPYHNTSASYADFLGSLSYGRYSGLYEQMFRENAGVIMIAFIVIFLGIIALLLSVSAAMCRLPQAPKAAMMSVFTLVSGFWILFDMGSQTFPLLVNSPVLSSIYNVLILYIITPCCLLVFSEYTAGTIQKWIRICTTVLFIISGAMVLLQVPGIFQLYEHQELITSISYAFLAAAMILTGIDAIHHDNHFARYLIISLLPCTFAAIYESMTYYSYSTPASFVFSIGLLITILLLLFQLVFLIQQGIDARHRTEKLEEELEKNRISSMISQIQPHFIYNVLNAISGLCSTDPEQADNAIITFSKYLRSNIDSLESGAPVTFYEEKRHIRQYIELEQLRFGDKIRVEYDIGFSDFTLPPLTLQPLVENAVKHGIAVKPNGGTVFIRTVREGDTVVITIQDDGVGFDVSEYRSAERDRNIHRSVGLHNVESRLSFISGAKMKVESTPGKGTVITIRMPISLPGRPSTSVPSGTISEE